MVVAAALLLLSLCKIPLIDFNILSAFTNANFSTELIIAPRLPAAERGIILTILFYGIILIYLYLGKKYCGEINTFTLKSGIVIPLANIVFSYLAIKAIRKDENLVRSINRMRK